eukprot:3724969-Pleurochrysis_carterae.AAC.3
MRVDSSFRSNSSSHLLLRICAFLPVPLSNQLFGLLAFTPPSSRSASVRATCPAGAPNSTPPLHILPPNAWHRHSSVRASASALAVCVHNASAAFLRHKSKIVAWKRRSVVGENTVQLSAQTCMY